jgi:hypothetical protein
VILVRDRGESLPVLIIEDVVLEAVDDVLPGTVRQQDDPLGHFLDPLPFAHPEGGEDSLHRFALLLLRFLRVQVRHGQAELVHHELAEHLRWQVAQQLGQVLCIVHRLPLSQGVDRVGISPTRPFFLLGCADRWRSAYRTILIVSERCGVCQAGTKTFGLVVTSSD